MQGFLQPYLEPVLGRWLYVDSSLWTVTGFLGAAIFGSRFLLQWLQSEKEKKLVIPWYFWHLSFWGSVLNLLYFLHLDKAPLILGNCFLPVLYGRNIIFLRREGTRGGRKVFAAVVGLFLIGGLWAGLSRPKLLAEHPEELAPAQLKRAAFALEQYAKTFGTLPLGDSRQILAALTGKNDQQRVFLQSDDGQISAEGDWLDPWGHPYVLSTSGKIYVLYSKGANASFDAEPSSADDYYLAGQVK